ncbi:MAG TPA: amidohydrolase family protein [Xanthobacteraceae bacterium]|nr:amidohydrolase family protein [Xanthobacteraceae bacterium]
MRTVTVEEHFASPGFLDGPGREVREEAKGGGRFARIITQLTDIGDGRVALMDAAGIDVQVLSLTAPGLEQSATADAIAAARESNDYLAAAVKKHPTRFAGLAALPVGAPDKAVEELERRVKRDGFKGAVINGHNNGRYLDDKFFWPILECAETLNVPIYLHPARPPKAVMAAQYGGFSPIVDHVFAGPGWGWHIETALHMIRIVLGGVFDRYPKLQFAVGHLGEGLIGLFQRFDRAMPPAMTKLQRPFGDYLRQNVHYSFSGFNFHATFLALLCEVGVERIMFSVDHPYQSMAEGRAFLDQIPVSPADRERIAHLNADKLFGL